jgi:hypothetical protein
MLWQPPRQTFDNGVDTTIVVMQNTITKFRLYIGPSNWELVKSIGALLR